MKNIPKGFLRQCNSASVEEALRQFLVPGAGNEECREVCETVLKKALFRMVADADYVAPRYGMHAVEHAVKRSFCLLDDFLQCLRVGVGRVRLVRGVEEFFVDVLQRVARQAGLDLPNVKEGIEKEEGHCWQPMVCCLVLKDHFVATKAVVTHEANPFLFSFGKQVVEEGHEQVVRLWEGQGLHLLQFLPAGHVVLRIDRRLHLLFGQVRVDATKEPVLLRLGGDLMNGTVSTEVKAYITGELEVVVDDQCTFPEWACILKIH